MAEIVNIPIEEIYDRWAEAVSSEVGENYTIDDIDDISKVPYAKLTLLGNPSASNDLDGNEDAVFLSFQIEVFTAGQNSLSKLYKIDSESHKAMLDMGFTRTYGPKVVKNIDTRVKRGVSRYSRILAREDNI